MGHFSIPPGAATASTRGSDFWIHDGILYGRTRPRSEHGELSDAVDAVHKLRDLTDGTPMPLLFDARQVGWLQLKAREHIHGHAAELFTRAGVVVSRHVTQALSYGLLGIARPEIPVKVFVDEDEAYSFVAKGLDPYVP